MMNPANKFRAGDTVRYTIDGHADQHTGRAEAKATRAGRLVFFDADRGALLSGTEVGTAVTETS